MKILFFVSQFTIQNRKLQPWLTIYRVGSIFKAQGHQVHIATDIKPSVYENFFIYGLKSLRGTNYHQIKQLIQKIQPDKIVVCVSPFSLITACWYSVFKRYDAYAFMSHSFYNVRQYVKAFSFLSAKNILEYGRHIIVIDLLWSLKLRKLFKGIICQSTNTKNFIEKKTKAFLPVHYIPPGIDIEQWPFFDKSHLKVSESTFLYAGSPKKIRGFDLILRAFSKIAYKDVVLRILARGEDAEGIKVLKKKIDGYGFLCQTEIVGGWVSPEKFREEVCSATAILLPFLIVPSELPVTVMESIACGTPPIVTDIDGLPGAVEKAGIVIPQADPLALSEAITAIHLNKKILKPLHQACLFQRGQMQSWEKIANQWLNFFHTE